VRTKGVTDILICFGAPSETVRTRILKKLTAFDSFKGAVRQAIGTTNKPVKRVGSTSLTSMEVNFSLPSRTCN
jgi:hypothetical protein